MKVVELRNITLRNGMPVICVPVMGTEKEILAEEIKLINDMPCDLAEWRADYLLEQLEGKSLGSAVRTLLDTLGFIKSRLKKPLIFTIRTANEGGQTKIPAEDYFFINRMVVDSGMADLIDIESFMVPETDLVSEFIKYAHAAEQAVILSNHDFEKTPSVADMTEKYSTMMGLGGDIIKLAVMPRSEEDVAALLEAASLIHDEKPEQMLIAISMGELGMCTRICAGLFGSVITFASGENASAPGQIDAVTLREYLDKYYK